ncbi:MULTISPECIES: hypothetical protein [unclassified Leptolyngbya]|uniref:hypothetical protein n=1 Tax=unclassified Leptolyngbya TaxID=2650499 RepID=UPI001686C93A|nr:MULTISPECIES: hypothetical protein [unclassified Leptolyngbya]MBD1912214.1 hypothetical protein [Leptolyngbya sp. FACHB-8]MBD2155105.1 hypothetical protein [Leptolyngbya sp. FACHB-16]
MAKTPHPVVYTPILDALVGAKAFSSATRCAALENAFAQAQVIHQSRGSRNHWYSSGKGKANPLQLNQVVLHQIKKNSCIGFPVVLLLRLCIAAVSLGFIRPRKPQLILNCGETDGKTKYSEKDIRIFPEIVPLL